MLVKSVLFTNSHAELGGGELALLGHIRHLRNQDVAVSVFLLDSGPLKSELEKLGANVVESSFAWQGNKIRSALLIIRRIIDVYRMIRSEFPDLVIAYTFNDFVFSSVACKIARCPIVYRAQGEVFPDQHKVGGSWLKQWFPAFAKFVRPRILCTTQYEARNMIAAGVPENLVGTIYLGVEKSPPLSWDNSLRNIPIIGIFGRLVRWKGQDTFVKAMGELKKRGVLFEAWIVGGSSFGDGDEYESELKSLIENNGVDEQVKLLGFRRDVPDLMSKCTLVCHCSDFEPFGLVIVEAMMAGKPVVASDVSGPQESIQNGMNGFLVSPRNPIALADKLQMLIGDSVLREHISKNAKKHAETKFDIERNLRLIDDECNRIRSEFFRP